MRLQALQAYFLFLHGQLCISRSKTDKLLSKYIIKEEIVETQGYIYERGEKYITWNENIP